MSKVVVEGHRKDKLKHIDPTTIIIGKRFREDLDIDDLVNLLKKKVSFNQLLLILIIFYSLVVGELLLPYFFSSRPSL